jgi:hypothetical protein
MLVVRVFVGPDGVYQFLVAGGDGVVVSDAFERAHGGGLRSSELVHLHVCTGEIEPRRMVVFVDFDHKVDWCGRDVADKAYPWHRTVRTTFPADPSLERSWLIWFLTTALSSS